MATTANEPERLNLPLPPLDTVGIGPPGPDFDREASLLAGKSAFELHGRGRDSWVVDNGPDDAQSLKYLYGRALYSRGFSMPVRVKGTPINVRFVSGSYLDIDEYGPVDDFADPGTGMQIRPEVLVLGKHPGRAEVEACANFVGPSSEIFFNALVAAGVPKAVSASWYATNLVKHEPVDPGSDRLSADLISNCRPLLAIEMRLLLPRFILCLGGDAVKAVLPGENVARMLGRVEEYPIALHRRGQEPRHHKAQVMCVIHPAAVYRDPKLFGELRDGLATFWDLIRDRPIVRAEKVRHVACYSADALRYELARASALHADSQGRITAALDGEWQGDFPIDKLGGDDSNYVRTWQISTAPGEAIIAVLRDDKGVPCFDGGIESASKILGEFLTPRGGWQPRIGGHWFRADLPWALRQLNIDLRPLMEPAADPEGTRYSGFDTGYMAHAHTEDLGVGAYSLKSLAARRCRMAPWDLELDAWKKAYIREKKLADEDFEGYGACPDSVLVGVIESGSVAQGKAFVKNSYAGFDSDATLRLERLYNGFNGEPGLLDCDDFGLSSRNGYWLNMASFLAFLEMEMMGVEADRRRADELVDLFMGVYNALLERFRLKIRWTNFNPASANQCRELLFGEDLNGSRDKETGAIRRLRPDWSSPRAGSRPGNRRLEPLNPKCLNLVPIKAAGQKGMTWERVLQRGQVHLYNPSTDKSTLSIMGWKHPLVAELRDLRYVNQVLKGVLRKPRFEDGAYVKDDEDLYEYDGGLVYWVSRHDHRVRTHFFPVETGRISSSRPNLTNVGKSREADYERILGRWVEEDGKRIAQGKYLKALKGPRYIAPVRSILCAAPGRVLVEADFKSAELCILAWLARSPRMRSDIVRSMLPDDDPNFLDLHAQTACMAFGLTCPPTKKGLKDIGKVNLRTGGKCVVAGSKLHTTSGWIDIEDLVRDHQVGEWRPYAGDMRVANDAEPTPIVGTYSDGVRPCVRVVTEYGYELTSTRPHRYRTIDSYGCYAWKAAGDLEPGDWICVRASLGPFGTITRFDAPRFTKRTSAKPIAFPDEWDADWAAFLGLFVAEGSASTDGMVQFGFKADDEFNQHVRVLLRRLFGDRLREHTARREGGIYDYYVICSRQLAYWLIDLAGSYSASRKIPAPVWSWPEPLVRTFLSWYFEGDGSVTANGKNFDVTWGSDSEQLVREIQILLGGFGVIASKTKSHRPAIGQTCYVGRVLGMYVKTFAERVGFLSARKQAPIARDTRIADRRVVPNQTRHLEILFPALRGQAREKARECLRAKARVDLNPTRLTIVLEDLATAKLTEEQQASFAHLRRIAALEVSYQKVAKVEDAGDLPVFDVTTTDEHVVTYNNLLTHQTVNYGVVYGLGDEALAIKCAEEGNAITVEEASRLKQGYFDLYPENKEFLDACRMRVLQPGWMMDAYGRLRRFYAPEDESTVAELQRSAMNFPIQATVADAMRIGMMKLYRARDNHQRRTGVRLFDMLLQVHDSVLVECFPEHASASAAMIKHCLSDDNPIRPIGLGGDEPSNEEFHLGVDIEVFERWGDALKPARLAELGIVLPSH